MRVSKWLVIVVFIAVSCLRLVDALRPVDGASWREADMASIARNFDLEGMDPRFPRIDWRGKGPGYVEMEFPFTSWLTALTYKAFGIHDVIGRLWSLAFSMATLVIFLLLAREYLGHVGSLIAFAFFALNPLVMDASTSFKPEAVMMFAYVSAVYFFLKWYRLDANKDLLIAMAMTALALLAKATAAHIGILFGVLLIQKYGRSVVFKPKIWVFFAVSLVPAALWYIHGKRLWMTFGNSLGISNEYHWIGWDFFTNSYFIQGILKTEAVDVWVVFGLAVLILVLTLALRAKVVTISLIWIVSIFVMYIAAARTTADDWANYYHIFAVAPAALLLGFGSERLSAEARIWADNFSRFSSPARALRAAVIVLVAIATCSAFAIESIRARSAILEHRVKDPDFQFAASIAPLLTNDGLVLVSGGPCFDDDGYPVAYNKSYMFYALDRKGSNICVEDQSSEKVESFAEAGYVYFVAQRMEIEKLPGFGQQLLTRYPIVESNGEYTIFDLRKEGSN